MSLRRNPIPARISRGAPLRRPPERLHGIRLPAVSSRGGRIGGGAPHETHVPMKIRVAGNHRKPFVPRTSRFAKGGIAILPLLLMRTQENGLEGAQENPAVEPEGKMAEE